MDVEHEPHDRSTGAFDMKGWGKGKYRVVRVQIVISSLGSRLIGVSVELCVCSRTRSKCNTELSNPNGDSVYFVLLLSSLL